jgi:hypothetical protein
MKTRMKNIKLKKTMTHTRKSKNKSDKNLKGGSFLVNWVKSFSTPENKELKEDLNNLLTYKETIRKTIQSMHDNAKDTKIFNDNYTLFTQCVSSINVLVTRINKHRTVATNPVNPVNTKSYKNPTNPTNPVNPVNAKSYKNTKNAKSPTQVGNTDGIGILGAIGAGAGAVVGIADAKNALMGSN